MKHHDANLPAKRESIRLPLHQKEERLQRMLLWMSPTLIGVLWSVFEKADTNWLWLIPTFVGVFLSGIVHNLSKAHSAISESSSEINVRIDQLAANQDKQGEALSFISSQKDRWKLSIDKMGARNAYGSVSDREFSHDLIKTIQRAIPESDSLEINVIAFNTDNTVGFITKAFRTIDVTLSDRSEHCRIHIVITTIGSCRPRDEIEWTLRDVEDLAKKGNNRWTLEVRQAVDLGPVGVHGTRISSISSPVQRRSAIRRTRGVFFGLVGLVPSPEGNSKWKPTGRASPYWFFDYSARNPEESTSEQMRFVDDTFEGWWQHCQNHVDDQRTFRWPES